MIHCKLSFVLSVISLLLLLSWKVYGYAEIHYTFFRYSAINRGYPEILVDMPWRVDAGQPIPVVCIIKDADRFPVKLKRIIARCKMKGGEALETALLNDDIPLYVSDQYWHKLFSIEPPDGQTGDMEVAVEIEFVRNGVKRTIISDNLPGLSHAPLNVFVSPYKLPAFDGWYYGDPHYHSDMTQDQVEFGAPVEVAAVMGRAMGLSWFTVADHSYDLDVAVGEYFQHDPKRTRWRRVREDVERLNSENNGFVVIPAEEVSCGNCKSRNIHLLAFDTPQFIPGKGDGIKRGLNKRPDLSLRQCINTINNMGGFAYAAHPEAGNGFLGTLMLNRDHWRDPDYAQGGYIGLQFWNGMADKEFEKSREKWIQLLLEGRRLYVLAGNDAHGDFNRCRKVKYPNTKLSESYDHIFGKVRTYAYCGGAESSADAILDALKNGRTVVTNGPVAILEARNGAGHTASIGEEITGGDFTLTIRVRSSEEFGQVDRVRLYRGDLIDRSEHVEKTFVPSNSEMTHVFTHRIAHRNRCYVRVEAKSSVGSKRYRCLTNPIWLRSA
jgi:hypothetical protein